MRMRAATLSGVGVGMAAGMVLLVASGVGYRTLAARYNRPTSSVPIPPGTLAKLPLELGDWVGRDRPLAEAVVRATAVDDHISRRYRRLDGRGSVSLFVAYGVNLRDLAPHRPEVCYTSVGLVLEETREATLTATDGVDLPCRVYRFKRGGLAAESVTVLNYYIVDGKYCPDVSLLRSKVWRLSLQADYSAQVQITCGGSPRGSTTAGGLVRTFASDSAAVIRDLLAAAVASASVSGIEEGSDDLR